MSNKNTLANLYNIMDYLGITATRYITMHPEAKALKEFKDIDLVAVDFRIQRQGRIQFQWVAASGYLKSGGDRNITKNDQELIDTCISYYALDAFTKAQQEVLLRLTKEELKREGIVISG